MRAWQCANSRADPRLYLMLIRGPAMKTIFAIAAAAMTSASLAADRPQDRWNLADLYPSVEAWNADAQKVESQFADIAACKGHLGDSAAHMRECLDLQSDTLKRYFRLAVYAN